jgi:hypothetical protein
VSRASLSRRFTAGGASTVERRLPAKAVIEVLERVFAERGMPEYLRSDNPQGAFGSGPEFIAKPIQGWLKQRQVHQQVINMYQDLLFTRFAQYQNDAVKHKEAWSEPEVEFKIYLTGTFMRLLLQLSQTPAKSS